MRGIHRWPVISPKKGQLPGKYFHLMTSSLANAAGLETVRTFKTRHCMQHARQMQSMGIYQIQGSTDIYSWSTKARYHDDVNKWKHFPRYWPFVWGIHQSPVNSPHKVQWRGALMFTLICARINGWVNNREAGDLRRHRAHYNVIVIWGGCCEPTVRYLSGVNI